MILDSSAPGFGTIAVSMGRRGVQIEVTLGVVIEVARGVVAPIADLRGRI